MTCQPGWDALITTSVLAWVSALLGFFLYRYSQSTVKQKGLRFSGAAAIALVMYFAMTKFYLSVQAQLNPAPVVDVAAVQAAFRDFDTCAEQEGADFRCSQPAMELRDVCARLLPRPE
jgi:hypothetical protein